MKKTKTIGGKSESFGRELDSSLFLLNEEQLADVEFLKQRPQAGDRMLEYFLHQGLKYKEVFDAINIADYDIYTQTMHHKKIKALLLQLGWQGKIDLHTKPVTAFDHPSAHFHLWGSPVTEQVYSAISKYLLDNRLTYQDRLKATLEQTDIKKIPLDRLKELQSIPQKPSTTKEQEQYAKLNKIYESNTQRYEEGRARVNISDTPDLRSLPLGYVVHDAKRRAEMLLHDNKGDSMGRSGYGRDHGMRRTDSGIGGARAIRLNKFVEEHKGLYDIKDEALAEQITSINQKSAKILELYESYKLDTKSSINNVVSIASRYEGSRLDRKLEELKNSIDTVESLLSLKR